MSVGNDIAFRQHGTASLEEPEFRLIYSWYVVFILMTMNVFSWFDHQIIAMLIDPIKYDLQISELQIGLLTTAAFAVTLLIYGVGQMPNRTKKLKCSSSNGGTWIHMVLWRGRLVTASC